MCQLDVTLQKTNFPSENRKAVENIKWNRAQNKKKEQIHQVTDHFLRVEIERFRKAGRENGEVESEIILFLIDITYWQ